MAGYWDRRYSEDPEAFGREGSSLARAALGPLLRDAAGGRLVELGCGAGRDLCYFAQHGFVVEGCDSSAVAARLANRRLAELREDAPLVALVRDVDAIEFLAAYPPGAADVVFSNLYLNLEVDPARLRRVMEGIARALRPRGWNILSVRSTSDAWLGRGVLLGPQVVDPGESRPPLRFFTEADVRALAAPLFEVVSLREHPDGDADFPVVVWSAMLQRRD